MPTQTEVKACRACARSKRRCDRERPACRRCRDRQQDCDYPPAKRSNFVVLEDEEECYGLPPVPAQQERGLPEAGNDCSGDGVGHDMMLGELLNMPLPTVADMYPQLRLALGTAGLPGIPCVSGLSAPLSPSSLLPFPAPPQPRRPALWFLAPETWKIDHRPDPNTAAYESEPIRGQIENIQRWLRRWAATGGCPFIHPSLYRARLPDCVQVALLAMTSYVHRTEATADLVLRIVDAQASKLLADNGVAPSDDGGLFGNGNWNAGRGGRGRPCPTSSSSPHSPSPHSPNSPGSPSSPPSSSSPGLLEQLARTHALVVYQVIGLFDGDIRARHLAEGRLALLGCWAGQLIESARQSLSSAQICPQLCQLAGAEKPWYLWILSESIRRTWAVAGAVEAIYGILQHGWYPCPGNAMFTTRHGLWEARSAADWEERWAETASADDLLAYRFEFGRFFAEASAADIDEFSRALMASTYGHDRVRRWERNSGGVRIPDRRM